MKHFKILMSTISVVLIFVSLYFLGKKHHSEDKKKVVSIKEMIDLKKDQTRKTASTNTQLVKNKNETQKCDNIFRNFNSFDSSAIIASISSNNEDADILNELIKAESSNSQYTREISLSKLDHKVAYYFTALLHANLLSGIDYQEKDLYLAKEMIEDLIDYNQDNGIYYLILAYIQFDLQESRTSIFDNLEKAFVSKDIDTFTLKISREIAERGSIDKETFLHARFLIQNIPTLDYKKIENFLNKIIDITEKDFASKIWDFSLKLTYETRNYSRIKNSSFIHFIPQEYDLGRNLIIKTRDKFYPNSKLKFDTITADRLLQKYKYENFYSKYECDKATKLDYYSTIKALDFFDNNNIQ